LRKVWKHARDYACASVARERKAKEGFGMKRLFVAVVALALCMGAAATSFAQENVAPHWTTKALSFRTTGLFSVLVAADPTAKRGSGTTGYIDSTTISRVGSGSAVVETTTAILTSNWAPPAMSGFFATSSDTIVQCRFTIQNTVNSADDSAYVQPQVSVDNINWFCANEVKDATNACNPTAAASLAVSTCPMLMLGATATPRAGSLLFRSRISGMNLADINSLWTWPLVRFIVVRDVSNAAVLATQSAYISFLTSQPFANPR
jgi:hypothetical protein